MSYRNRAVVGEVLASRLGERALDQRSCDRVWTIENNNLGSGFRRRFQKISERSFVSIETHAGVLQVKNNGIKLLQNIQRRTARLVTAAINAIDRNSCCRVARVADVSGIQFAGNAVFRAEDCGQLHSGRVRQQIDGAAARGVDAGLIGQNADAFAFQNGEVL